MSAQGLLSRRRHGNAFGSPVLTACFRFLGGFPACENLSFRENKLSFRDLDTFPE